MATSAKGTFEVALDAREQDQAEGSSLGRMSIDKRFHGDLEGTSKGQMLTATTGVKTSAGYVAMERVTGSLHGRQGSFVLQHSGIMSTGLQRHAVTVVPDSGSGQLVGLSGEMAIQIADGKHSYDLVYTLPDL